MTMTIKIYGMTEFGKIMGDEKRWNAHTLSVYYRRGKLPKPFAIAGTRPFWTLEQIEAFKKEKLQEIENQ